MRCPGSPRPCSDGSREAVSGPRSGRWSAEVRLSAVLQRPAEPVTTGPCGTSPPRPIEQRSRVSGCLRGRQGVPGRANRSPNHPVEGRSGRWIQVTELTLPPAHSAGGAARSAAVSAGGHRSERNSHAPNGGPWPLWRACPLRGPGAEGTGDGEHNRSSFHAKPAERVGKNHGHAHEAGVPLFVQDRNIHEVPSQV